MFPTHDHIAQAGIMAMIPKVAAVKLKLDPNPLPSIALGIDTSFGLTVRVRSMDSLNDEAQFVTDHAEQENHPLFIDRSMS